MKAEKQNNHSNEKKLSLLDTVGMSIGGMVGGGIFAVLGEASNMSGNAAFISFGIAGILALITGISYTRLTQTFDEAGGSFSYVEKLSGSGPAGTLSWFLILGYLFTISLYAHTFGAYTSRLFGSHYGLGPYLGGLAVIILSGINLAGVRESGVSEDILVYAKVAILLILSGVAFSAIKPQEFLPIMEHSPTTVIGAAALIFVGYEGFQLLTYDYNDISKREKNLPRSVWISIPAVIVIYMMIAFVTTGTVGDQIITKHKETILAYVAEPILGKAGFTIVLIAAVISTASAINATLFATARLTKRVANDQQLPSEITRWETGGVSVVFICIMTVFAIVIQFVGNLHQITTFSSLVFLLVFAIVNMVALIHREYKDWYIVFPIIGSLGCFSAAVALVYDTVTTDLTTLWIISGITAVLLILRFVYMQWHPEFLDKIERKEIKRNDI
ncbi:amino acid permease [Candidatus Poribacteria bacterium]|nr:amino acid permease [Candidatus Poribacteria bacterium]